MSENEQEQIQTDAMALAELIYDIYIEKKANETQDE